MVDKLEDSLEGGYEGLYGEVWTQDCYRLRELQFSPSVVFDLGANVGVLTRFARELFKDAKIISVEPNPLNFEILKKFTPDDNTVFINKAVGVGTVWHYKDAVNGSHECYLSDGLGYDRNLLANEEMIGGCIEKIDIETVMPGDLVKEYIKNNEKYIFKIDIEGNEHTLWSDEETMEALIGAEYICMEVHFYALHGGALEEVRNKTIEAFTRLQETHWCFLNHTMFFALKK